MQVFCKKTSGHPELRCAECGQGFVLSWDRQTSVERAVIRAEVQEVLRRQHRLAKGQEPHPMVGFEKPELDCLFKNQSDERAPGWDL
jgi:hypothetical protein